MDLFADWLNLIKIQVMSRHVVTIGAILQGLQTGSRCLVIYNLFALDLSLIVVKLGLWQVDLPSGVGGEAWNVRYLFPGWFLF